MFQLSEIPRYAYLIIDMVGMKIWYIKYSAGVWIKMRLFLSQKLNNPLN